MTTYVEIQGQAVVNVAAEPSPVEDGQVWYNSATGLFQIRANGVTLTLETGL